jgi:hypothetical protein
MVLVVTQTCTGLDRLKLLFLPAKMSFEQRTVPTAIHQVAETPTRTCVLSISAIFACNAFRNLKQPNLKKTREKMRILS